MHPPVQIRRATAEDYEPFRALFLELGIDDPIPDRDRYARDLLPRMWVAEREGSMLGYTLYERLEDTGYVRNLVVTPTWRRRGVGRALMEHLRRFFADGGAARWCLNVEPGNTAAVTLYQRCGLQLAYEARSLRLAREAAVDPTPSTPTIDVRPADPGRDAELEARFALLCGQLASARARSGREVLAFTVEGEPVGVAVFDPSFPGAFPFRLERPRLVLAVLAYFRRRAPQNARWIQVVVEDDEALARSLLDRGATTALHYVHMRGSIEG